MANIMINKVCNLHCPYCFAQETFEECKREYKDDMPYKNFKAAVDWVNKSSDLAMDNDGLPYRIGIIGGEPLLHKDFEDFINYASDDRVRRRDQKICLFTNGILLENYARFLKHRNIDILLNINSYEDIGDSAYNKIVDGIEASRKVNHNGLSVGINYYKPGMKTDFIEDIIKEYEFDHLRVGIVAPNSQEGRDKGPEQYFKEIVPPIVDFLERLAKLGCAMEFDCQKIPHCYKEDYYERVEKICSSYYVRNEFTDQPICHPVIDIQPDLTIMRCFGCSNKTEQTKMSDFTYEQEAEGYYQTNYDNIGLLIPAFNDCVKCKQKSIGNCQGGCLAFKMKKIKATIGVE